MSQPVQPSSAHSVSLSTVKYSLPAMLAELQHERVSGSLAMEKLHQTEIGKIFQAQAQPRRRRAKSSQ